MQRGRAGHREAVVVLVLAGALVVGWTWPTWSAPGVTTAGIGGDAWTFMWFLAWFPHALGHGLEPLVPHVVGVPSGANLMWATSMPLVALLASPVTVVAGPVVAYDVVVAMAVRHGRGSGQLGRAEPPVMGGADGVAGRARHAIGVAVGNLSRCHEGWHHGD